MSIRNSWETSNKTFSVENAIDEIEVEMSTIMFISGMDGSKVGEYEIDEILEELKKSFPLQRSSIEVDSIISGIKPGYEFYINKNFSKLSLLLRRNNRWLKIAKYIKAEQNG
jgi:hypothetical protein